MTTTMPEGGGVQVNGLWYPSAQAAGLNGPTGTGLSAQGIINNLLAPLGLTSLASWAWNAYNQSGGSLDYVSSQLPTQQAFKDRFPEYDEMAARGDAMTPAQIVAAEQQTAQLFQQYGISGMQGYDPQTATAQLLIGNVSSSELNDRLAARQQAAAQYHPAVSAQLSSLYGINGDQALTAYVTDPDNALGMIQQQVAGAQAAAAGVSSGFGQIDAATATRLAQEGVTQSQAQTTFGQMGQLKQLGSALPGESGNGITQGQFIGAGFENNAQDAAAIAAEQGRRASQFSNRGAFAASQAGISGLGSAAT